MSLILFRGLPILPPVKHQSFSTFQSGLEEISDTDKAESNYRDNEESKLLSLPSSKALSVLLPGYLGQRGGCFCATYKKHNKSGICSFCINEHLGTKAKALVRSSSSCGRICSCSNKKKKGKCLSVSEWELHGGGHREDSSVSEEAALTSLSLSIDSSHLSDQETLPETDVDMQFEDEHGHCAIPKSASAHVCRTTGIMEFGKEKSPYKDQTSFNSACSDTSSHLEDYLNSLISNSPFHLEPKSHPLSGTGNSDNSRSLSSKRLSVPSQKQTNSKEKRRNLRLEGAKLNRSLGSTYLDSYLGNLTDHAWIVYPNVSSSTMSSSFTTGLVTMSSLSASNVILSPTKLLSELDVDHTYSRKMYFIKPEEFYKAKGKPSCLAFNNSEDVDTFSSKASTVDNATSPDVSSSIFDTETRSPHSQTSHKLEENRKLPSPSITANTIISLNTNEEKSASECQSNSEIIFMSNNSDSNNENNLPTEKTCSDNIFLDVQDKSDTNKVEKAGYRENTSSIEKQQSPKLYITNNYNNDKLTKDSTAKSAIKNKLSSKCLTVKRGHLEDCNEEGSTSSEVSSATEPSTIVLAGEQLCMVNSDMDLSLSEREPNILDKVAEESDQFDEYIGSKCFVKNLSSNECIVRTGTHINKENQHKDNSIIKASTCKHSSPITSSSSTISDVELARHYRSERKDYMKYLVYLLRAKHQEDMKQLIKKQTEEMNQFYNQLQQLSPTQLQLLVTASNSNSETHFDSATVASHLQKSPFSSSAKPNINKIHIPYVDSSIFHNRIGNNNSMNCTAVHMSSPSDGRKYLINEGHKSFSNASTPIQQHKLYKGSSDSTSNSPMLHKARHLNSTLKDNSPVVFDKSVSFSGAETLSMHRQRKELCKSKSFNHERSVTSVINCHSLTKCDTGHDLVAPKENHSCLKFEPINKHVQIGVCRMQACVRGRRIRRLLATKLVHQLLATLAEVAKLAHQFHQDIIMHNIKKGDVDYHKALFNEEKQTRAKLHNIVLDLSPAEQLLLIQRDKDSKQRELKPPILIDSTSTTKSPMLKTSITTKHQTNKAPPKRSAFSSSLSRSHTRSIPVSNMTKVRKSLMSIQSQTRHHSGTSSVTPHGRVNSEPPRIWRGAGVLPGSAHSYSSPRMRQPQSTSCTPSKVKQSPTTPKGCETRYLPTPRGVVRTVMKSKLSVIGDSMKSVNTKLCHQNRVCASSRAPIHSDLPSKHPWR